MVEQIGLKRFHHKTNWRNDTYNLLGNMMLVHRKTDLKHEIFLCLFKVNLATSIDWI